MPSVALESDADLITLFKSPESLGPNFLPNRHTVVCPEVFSLIDNPEQSLRAITKFVQLVLSGTTQIVVDQSRVQRTDLCASAVLNALAGNVRDYVGQFDYREPLSAEAKEIVWATGLPSMFGMEKRPEERFLVRPLTRGGPGGSGAKTSTQKEQEGTALIEYLDECYAKYGYRLTPTRRTDIGTLIAEVLANSEDHSDRPQWWVAAYLRQPSDAKYGDVHLAMFNLGKTIASTLIALDQSNPIRKGCEPTLATLRGAGSFRGKRYSEECFWTVTALQPGVTSKRRDVMASRDRGTGTVRIMEAFFDLGQSLTATEGPRMALLSGNTHIVFDGTYRLRPVVLDEDGRAAYRIAFNPENDLRIAPDRRYVRPLNGRFPGTVLSLRFYIDPEHLEQVPSHVQRHGA